MKNVSICCGARLSGGVHGPIAFHPRLLNLAQAFAGKTKRLSRSDRKKCPACGIRLTFYNSHGEYGDGPHGWQDQVAEYGGAAGATVSFCAAHRTPFSASRISENLTFLGLLKLIFIRFSQPSHTQKQTERQSCIFMYIMLYHTLLRAVIFTVTCDDSQSQCM